MFDTLSALQCPDCGTALPVRFVLLTNDMRLVLLTSCWKCADHTSVRCFKVIDRGAFDLASASGLPTVNYRKVA